MWCITIDSFQQFLLLYLFRAVGCKLRLERFFCIYVSITSLEKHCWHRQKIYKASAGSLVFHGQAVECRVLEIVLYLGRKSTRS